MSAKKGNYSNRLVLKAISPPKPDPLASVSLEALLEDTSWDEFKHQQFRRKMRDSLRSDVGSAELSATLGLLTTKLRKLLTDCKSDEVAEIANQVLSVNWANRVFSEEGIALVDKLFDFTTEYLAVGLLRLKVVLHQLIVPLLSGDKALKDERGPTTIEKKVFTKIHSFLRSVVHMYLPADELLIAALEKNFPYHQTTPLHSYVNYVLNTLMSSVYAKNRRRSLELVFDKLLWLDLNSENKSEEIFELDLEKEQQGNVLDCCFDQLLTFVNYLYSKCSSREELTKDIFGVFKKVILPSTDSCHLQFVLFYIASLDDQVCNQVLELFWETATVSTGLADDLKHRCAYYLSSFLIHAKYLSNEHVLHGINKMAKWLHSYIDSESFDHNISFEHNIVKHGLFHAVCQALFYTVIAKHQEFSEDSVNQVRMFNFQRIVSSELNPLAAVLPAIRSTFADVAKYKQLALCQSILQRNKRRNLNKVDHSPVPTCYYSPFSNFTLKMSSAKIEPLYNTYVENYFGYQNNGNGSRSEQSFTADEMEMDTSASGSMEKVKFVEMMMSSFSPAKDFTMSPL